MRPILQGETPLHNAIRKASLALVTYLVEHGADVNRQRPRRLDPDHDGGLDG